MSRLLEAELEKAATDLLELDGWRGLKTDPVSRREWGKGFGEKGMADYLYIRYGNAPLSPEAAEALKFASAVLQRYEKPERLASHAEVMWIEWKIPKGTVAEKQHAWREKERARGALALIAGVDFHASLEGFARWYAQSGLQRRRLEIGSKKT
jgi:hypothetical protein